MLPTFEGESTWEGFPTGTPTSTMSGKVIDLIITRRNIRTGRMVTTTD
jgi:hypothetical protein